MSQTSFIFDKHDISRIFLGNSPGELEDLTVSFDYKVFQDSIVFILDVPDTEEVSLKVKVSSKSLNFDNVDGIFFLNEHKSDYLKFNFGGKEYILDITEQTFGHWNEIALMDDYVFDFENDEIESLYGNNTNFLEDFNFHVNSGSFYKSLKFITDKPENCTINLDVQICSKYFHYAPGTLTLNFRDGDQVRFEDDEGTEYILDISKKLSEYWHIVGGRNFLRKTK